jgi:hypothetical protein
MESTGFFPTLLVFPAPHLRLRVTLGDGSRGVPASVSHMNNTNLSLQYLHILRCSSQYDDITTAFKMIFQKSLNKTTNKYEEI